MSLLSHRIAWVLGISVGGCAIGGGIAACSSSSSPSGNTSTPDGSTGAGTCSMPNSLSIDFNPMYSAFIPGSSTHTFLVPAVVNGVSGANVTWSASDSTAVGFQADPKTGGTTITVLKPGPVTISAKIGTDLCGSSVLNVSQNTEDEWAAGNARYNNGQPLINLFAMRRDGGAGDGGMQGRPPGGFTAPLPTDPSPLEPADGGPGPACTNCHGATATTGFFQGVDHTPEQTAGFSDQELIDIIVNGIIPDGGTYDPTIIPYRYWQYFHKWRDLSAAEQKGIVVYLRSLTPEPQGGKVDFGGVFRRDGGSTTPTGDDGGSTGDDASADTGAVTLDAGAAADAAHE